MNILAVVKLYAHKNKAGGELYLHHLLKQISIYHKVAVIVPSNTFSHTTYDDIMVVEDKDYKNYIDQSDIIITQLDLSPEVNKYALQKDKILINIFHGECQEYFKPILKNEKIIKIFNSNFVYKTCLKTEINGKKFIIYPYTPDFSQYATTDLKYRQFITFINPSQSKGKDIFYELVKEFPNKKFLLVEGGYYKHLQDIRYDLPNVVVQKSTNDMINDVYLKSKIVIQPSFVESYGMVSSEARSMGIPVIVNEQSEGLKENIGKIGLFGNNDDVKTYKKLIKLLDHQSTYILWSNLLLEQAENRFIQQQEQTDTFISYLNSMTQ